MHYRLSQFVAAAPPEAVKISSSSAFHNHRVCASMLSVLYIYTHGTHDSGIGGRVLTLCRSANVLLVDLLCRRGLLITETVDYFKTSVHPTYSSLG